MTKDRFVHPHVEVSFNGPWLLTDESLRKLDAIIDKYWRKFESRRKKLLRAVTKEAQKEYAHLDEKHEEKINEYVKQQTSISPLNTIAKALYIFVKSDLPAYKCDSFEKALLEIDLLDKSPHGFYLLMLSGDIKIEIRAESPSTDLRLTYQPEDVGEIHEFHAALDAWATEIQHRAAGKRTWARIADRSNLIIVVGVIIYGLLFILTQGYSATSTEQQQLFALSGQGITESNVVEAVNLLVRLQQHTGFRMPVITPALIIYPLVLGYLALALYIRPRVVLGIGKGRKTLQCWELFWQVVIIFPLFSIIIPYIVQLILNRGP